MRNLLMLCLIALITSCSNTPTSMKFLGLNGEVSSIRDTKFDVKEKFGEIFQNEIEEVSVYNFNSDGNVLNQTVYSPDGDMKYSFEHLYKDKNCYQTIFKRISFNLKTMDSDTITSMSKLLRKDGDFFIWENITDNSEPQQSKVEKSRSYIKTTTEISKDSKQISESWYSGSNLIEQKITTEDKVVFWTKSKYDNQNRAIELKYLEGNNKETISYSYNKMDNKGNWTECIEYKNGKPENIIIREIKYIH